MCHGAAPWKTGIFLRGRVEFFTGGWVSWCWVPKRDDTKNEKNNYKTDEGNKKGKYKHLVWWTYIYKNIFSFSGKDSGKRKISGPSPAGFLSRGSMYYSMLILHNSIKLLFVIRTKMFSWASNFRCTNEQWRRSHWMCSIKKVFLKISQKPQENTCVGVPFLIKMQAWGLQLDYKKTPTAMFYC